MINRLPQEHAAGLPANGVRPAEAFAPESEEQRQSLSRRALAAGANSIGAHPIISLGVAFALGIFLGKLVKR